MNIIVICVSSIILCTFLMYVLLKEKGNTINNFLYKLYMYLVSTISSSLIIVIMFKFYIDKPNPVDVMAGRAVNRIVHKYDIYGNIIDTDTITVWKKYIINNETDK